MAMDLDEAFWKYLPKSMTLKDVATKLGVKPSGLGTALKGKRRAPSQAGLSR